jgi:hypothetical protein
MISDRSKIIYNYRPRNFEVSSAEYIKKTTGKLDMTRTHGLGSGIYGVTSYEQREDESMTAIMLKKPLNITNEIMDSDLTEVSVWLIDIVEKTINKGKSQRDLTKTQKDLDVIKITGDNDEISRIETEISIIQTDINILTSEVSQLRTPEIIGDIISKTKELLDGSPISGFDYTPEEIRCKLFGAIKGFIQDYGKASYGDFLLQPIDYFLLSYGYDGIYNSSPTGDNFSRGSVAFFNKNPRNQKQAFGGVYLVGRNTIVYSGSVSECDIVEDIDTIHTITPRTRRRYLSNTTPRTRGSDIEGKTPRTAMTNMILRATQSGQTATRPRSRSRSRDRSNGGGSKKKRRYQTKKRNKKRITRKYKR